MSTYWFEALVLEPPRNALPGLRMHVAVKHSHTVETLDGDKRLCVGHEALRATELEKYVEQLKVELDDVVAEAKRRDREYHAKLLRDGSPRR